YRVSWAASSYLLKFMGNDFRENYEILFNSTRTLCLSKSKNSQHCWREFCNNNGLCIEFEFQPSDISNITHNDVVYVKSKKMNVLLYFKSIFPHRALKFKKKPPKRLWRKYHSVMKSRSTKVQESLINHIIFEVVFKKKNKFKKEYEYRYVHLENSISNINTEPKFINGKLHVKDLGLKMIRIYSTDPQKIIEAFPHSNNIVSQF